MAQDERQFKWEVTDRNIPRLEKQVKAGNKGKFWIRRYDVKSYGLIHNDDGSVTIPADLVEGLLETGHRDGIEGLVDYAHDLKCRNKLKSIVLRGTPSHEQMSKEAMSIINADDDLRKQWLDLSKEYVALLSQGQTTQANAILAKQEAFRKRVWEQHQVEEEENDDEA
jgi:hypothetical protein